MAARRRIMVVTKEERVMEVKIKNKERGWKRVQLSAQLMFHATNAAGAKVVRKQNEYHNRRLVEPATAVHDRSQKEHEQK